MLFYSVLLPIWAFRPYEGKFVQVHLMQNVDESHHQDTHHYDEHIQPSDRVTERIHGGSAKAKSLKVSRHCALLPLIFTSLDLSAW